jgi:hypothetical protein
MPLEIPKSKCVLLVSPPGGLPKPILNEASAEPSLAPEPAPEATLCAQTGAETAKRKKTAKHRRINVLFTNVRIKLVCPFTLCISHLAGYQSRYTRVGTAARVRLRHHIAL